MNDYDTIMESMMRMLPAPTAAHYMETLGKLCDSEYYDPHSKALDQMSAALEKERYAQLVSIFKQANPNYILHPEANMLMALAHKNLGDEKQSKLFSMSTITICQAIATTGDGSRKNPYIVSHESCGRAFVEIELEKEAVKQRVEDSLLAITSTDGTEIWFDVSRTLRAPAKPEEPADKDEMPDLSAGDPDNIEAISKHVEKHIGEIETVFHELISPTVHIDVLWVKPSEKRPYHVLVTSGMSELPMHAPEGAEDYRYAELLIALPPDWPLSQEAFKDEKNYWPIRWLKNIARGAHEMKWWVSYGHTIPNGDPAEPFAENTQMSCWLLAPPIMVADSDFAKLKINDEKTIHFLAMVPLYPEETELKLSRGADKLYDLFDKHRVTELLDLERSNVAPGMPGTRKRKPKLAKKYATKEEWDDPTAPKKRASADGREKQIESSMQTGCIGGLVVFIVGVLVIGSNWFSSSFGGFTGQMIAVLALLVMCAAAPFVIGYLKAKGAAVEEEA
ncbi:MAG TPA: suppressor of fused domain protein [Planctomycetota bacterium]|nr:suppressor of fused domain protein [Planctomycetota bacterium]